MKKFPTALTVPRISFRLWLKIAPPLDAIVPALGSEWVGGGPGAAGSEASDCDDRLPKIEQAGVDAVSLQETLDADKLRLERVAQHGGLLGDGGAAEEYDAGQHARYRQAHDGQPQRMQEADATSEQVAHGVERHAEQHAGEDQKLCRGEIPGEQQ